MPARTTIVNNITSNAAALSPNVGFVLPEVTAMHEKWDLIEDCLAGQEAIKKKKKKYLPQPNPEDKSPENEARYENYILRAVFYNVVANTTAGLVGQVFNSDPVTEYPPELEPMWYNADGRGVTLIQVAKKTLTTVVSMGRCGLLTDFPKAKADGTPYTRQEVLDGVARPTILYYGPKDVINWRYKQVGALSKLSLVTLFEDYVIHDDGFELKRGREIRALKLDDADQYVIETWRRRDNDESGPYYLFETSTPKDASGQPLDYIPFEFVGAQNNDSNIDKPPMYDMACLNIAHYRNSADYEDSVFMVGQPTPYFSGLTENWVKEVLKDTIYLGSRGAVPLPEGGQAGLIQASENSMVKEAMDKKEQQMVAIGAQLVEDKQVQRTLGEAKMESAVVHSTLTSCARNVSQAMENSMISAARFSITDVDPNKIIFQLSTDFAISKLSPDERRQLLAEWQGGILSFSEARNQLRQSGIANLDDEVAKAEIEKDMESRVDLGDPNPDNPDETDPNKPDETEE